MLSCEPERPFSQQQWAEVAKAISLDSISSNEKREIRDAIFAYEFDRMANERAADEAEEKSKKSTRRKVDPKAKGRAALGNFIKYTRGLRLALYSVEKYLKTEHSYNEADQLAEQIFKFQTLAKRELDKISLGGRPAQKIRDNLVIQLGLIYERLTGEKPKRTVNKDGHVGGRFAKFVYAIFQAYGISIVGLPNAIAKAVLYAKNQH